MAEPRALVVDYGGVLTEPLTDAMAQWCAAERVGPAEFAAVMKDWLGTSYGDAALGNPVHALERGELTVPDFERELAQRLRTVDGGAVEPAGLLARMFAGFGVLQPQLLTALRRARSAGLRTALLSNSWGLDYPREGWDELFDTVVISGEVGMRKPEPEIYLLVATRLGVGAAECVFVDDLTPNIRGAVAVSMVGIHHRDAEQTVDELEALFGLSLR
jgi:epoxide hydrolase-like predicted phosphatase